MRVGNFVPVIEGLPTVGPGVPCIEMRAMQEIDEKTLRDQLKTKRNLLLEEFRKNPSNTRLAIEIRLIDEQIASLTEYLIAQRTK